MAAAVKGYRCIFVLPDKMSDEKIRLLAAYGAEIVITPTAVPPDSPESYNAVADRLSHEIPDAWRPNQFSNLANPEVHYRSPDRRSGSRPKGGSPLSSPAAGQGDHLRRGPVSEGKECRDQGHRRRSRRLDPLRDSPRVVEGRGDQRGLRPRTLNSHVVDEWIRVGDAESFHIARELCPQGRDSGRRLERNGCGRRACGSPAGWVPTTSLSSFAPTRAETT